MARWPPQRLFRSHTITCPLTADSDEIGAGAAGMFWDALDGSPDDVSSSACEDDKDFEDRLSNESNIYR
jgi:hypothetical protein